MKSMRSALRSTRAPTRAAHSPDPESVTIPMYARTFSGFRRWTCTDSFPERGKISFLAGAIYTDLNPEPIQSHNFVKTELIRVLATLVVTNELGTFMGSGCRLVNKVAELSTQPDALFASWETLKSYRMTLQDDIELVGTPDWTLEIVSPSSEERDKHTLRRLYHQARVPEYWLASALNARLSFRMMIRGRLDYLVQQPRQGWLYSPTFDAHFRLERSRDRMGEWQYRLHVKKS